jgi:hypothetical protein
MSIHIFDDEYTGPRFTYGCTIRPPARFSIPEGYICDSQRDNPRFRYGTVDYPAPITQEEADHYDMILVVQPEQAS